MRIAIHPDDYTNPKIGKPDASSPRWAELLEKAGHKVKWVDVRRTDILDQIKDCDGFMWRHGHFPQHRQIARRLLPVIENELGLEVYPDQATCWHYDDKIAQYYLLTAAGIPMPKTWVWFDFEQAMDCVRTIEFPLVIKLWSGAGSANIQLVRGLAEAEIWLKRLFSLGIAHIEEGSPIPSPICLRRRVRDSARILLKGTYPSRPWELHKNYVLFQEFIPDNSYDTRIAIIGNRGFGLRRFNRPNDFRASGSGNCDYDPDEVDLHAVRLGLRVAARLGTHTIFMDVLTRGEERLVTEISYTAPSQQFPGYWELRGEDLVWNAGILWQEEAQIQDFLARLENREKSKRN